MSKRLAMWVVLVVLIALVVGSGPGVLALTGPKGSITGFATGFLPDGLWIDQYGNLAVGEFQYQYGITEVGPDGAANGWAHVRIRAVDPIGPWVQFYIAVDRVRFTTVDGKPAAFYSGRIAKSTMYEWYEEWACDWQGQLFVGMVIDGGTRGQGDQLVYWEKAPGGCFFPDQGEPLPCEAPVDGMEIRWNMTGGDVVVRAP